VSNGSSLNYRIKSYGYCVSATNPKSDKTYRVKSTDQNKIEEGGCDVIVSTLAGSGSVGPLDGQGTAARFYYPYGIDVDTSGNVYVADSGNNRIRKITPSGAVTTPAGSGTNGYLDGIDTVAQFNSPHDVAVGNNGEIFVADFGGNRIRKIVSD
jgi:hypothetical protein